MKKTYILILLTLSMLMLSLIRNFFLKKRVEVDLNIEINSAVSDIHYYKYQPNKDLKFYRKYICFKTDRNDYNEITKSLSKVHSPIPNTDSSWELLNELQLDWWKVSNKNDSNIIIFQKNINGFLKIKFENQYVYIIIEDY